jgi:hypothetical protein
MKFSSSVVPCQEPRVARGHASARLAFPQEFAFCRYPVNLVPPGRPADGISTIKLRKGEGRVSEKYSKSEKNRRNVSHELQMFFTPR